MSTSNAQASEPKETREESQSRSSDDGGAKKASRLKGVSNKVRAAFGQVARFREGFRRFLRSKKSLSSSETDADAAPPKPARWKAFKAALWTWLKTQPWGAYSCVAIIFLIVGGMVGIFALSQYGNFQDAEIARLQERIKRVATASAKVRKENTELKAKLQKQEELVKSGGGAYEGQGIGAAPGGEMPPSRRKGDCLLSSGNLATLKECLSKFDK